MSIYCDADLHIYREAWSDGPVNTVYIEDEKRRVDVVLPAMAAVALAASVCNELAWAEESANESDAEIEARCRTDVTRRTAAKGIGRWLGAFVYGDADDPPEKQIAAGIEDATKHRAACQQLLASVNELLKEKGVPRIRIIQFGEKPEGGGKMAKKPTIAEDLIAGFSELADALERGDAAGWRPIETAPKDGTPILVWVNDRCHIMRSDDLLANPAWLDGFNVRYWQPLPAPPGSTPAPARLTEAVELLRKIDNLCDECPLCVYSTMHHPDCPLDRFLAENTTTEGGQ